MGWLDSTRFKLANITFIRQDFIPVDFINQQLNPEERVFECINKLIMTRVPQNSTDPRVIQYGNFVNETMKNIEERLSRGLLDASWVQTRVAQICQDASFNRSFECIINNYSSILKGLPLLAAYSAVLSISRVYRLYFLDDSAFPSTRIYEATVLVDLINMRAHEISFLPFIY